MLCRFLDGFQKVCLAIVSYISYLYISVTLFPKIVPQEFFGKFPILKPWPGTRSLF